MTCAEVNIFHPFYIKIMILNQTATSSQNFRTTLLKFCVFLHRLIPWLELLNSRRKKVPTGENFHVTCSFSAGGKLHFKMIYFHSFIITEPTIIIHAMGGQIKCLTHGVFYNSRKKRTFRYIKTIWSIMLKKKLKQKQAKKYEQTKIVD